MEKQSFPVYRVFWKGKNLRIWKKFAPSLVILWKRTKICQKKVASFKLKREALKVKKMEGNKIISILFTPKLEEDNDSEMERELSYEDR